MSGRSVGAAAGMLARAAVAPGTSPFAEAMIKAARVSWYKFLNAFLIGGGFRMP